MNCFLRLHILLLAIATLTFTQHSNCMAQVSAQATATVNLAAQDDPPVKAILMITLDGLRWQEVFTGAEERLISREGGVKDVDGTRQAFWRNSPEERREILLPFLWNEIVPRGQLFGSVDDGSPMRVTNGHFFSYPGYNELLTGKPDPRVDSNDKIPNPNTTVLEWLNHQAPFQDSVIAYGSWDVFPFIINEERSGIPVNAGWEPLTVGGKQRINRLNRMADEMPHVWPGVRYDHFTAQGAIAHMRQEKPRVIYVSLGETDDWAHEGRYDLYLDSARRDDAYIRLLWQTMQSFPEYRGKTAMILSTDHGRGDGFEGWKSHGVDHAGSDLMWLAVMGPGVPALGVRQKIETTQGQYAPTAAALLGLDFTSTGDGIAKPLSLNQDANSSK